MGLPISEATLLRYLEVGEYKMRPQELAFWSRIRISPVKWQLSPWADLDGGFWVVSVVGQQCIWYNAIEEGFNVTPFTTFGVIGEYTCNQAELHECIRTYCQEFLREMQEALQGA